MANYSWIMFNMLLWSRWFSTDSLILQTPNGLLRGTERLSRDTLPFKAFLAVPYAEPPVGSFRFKLPIPHRGWQGIRNATKDAPICVQDDLNNEIEDVGQEDCLYLNVYSPMRMKGIFLPVMVYIHGGGFYKGQATSDVVGPEYFMDQNVVLVTIQYRLGLLGFLRFQNEYMPGNLGLKDQVLALKWVKENIGFFGGDSTSVTIFGESAGAASVNLHLVSPMSEGLFHKAILQSGSAVSPKVLIPGDVARDRAHRVAQLVGCSDKCGEKLIVCLQQVPLQALVNTADKFFEWRKKPETRFLPTVETSTSEPFLPRPPFQLPEKNIPVIIGNNFKEGALTAAPFCSNDYQGSVGLNEDPEEHIPLVLSSNLLKPQTKAQFVQRLEDFYLQDHNVGPYNFDGFINMISDIVYIHPAVESTRRHQDFGPVYFYLYNYQLPISLAQIGTNCSRYLGVGHGDDLFIFFKSKMSQLRPQDIAVSKQMIYLWTSFARDGVPGNPTWRPTKSPSIDYLYISNNNFSAQTGLLTERVDFVDTLSPLLVWS